ncbi:hypothetical protein ACHAWF_011470, partial [Thalassiosira exigua]
RPVLSGWRDPEGARLWYFDLLPEEEDLPQPTTFEPRNQATLAAYSAYDLPSVQALVRYFHAAAGFPVRDTWLRAIKNGNFDSWPGLTYNNAARYCPNADETLKGHMTQARQGVRSTKPKVAKPPPPPPPAQADFDPIPRKKDEPKSHELYVQVAHISRLYTDDTGRFPSRKDEHRLAAFDTIMERIKAMGHDVDLQILDNEASKKYRERITKEWGHKFQLVPPNMHRRNAAERAIRTFKAHFLSILSGVAPDFPRYLWDLLVPQAEMTLNFLRNASANKRMSAWEYFAGPFDYDATPLGPLGSRVIAHHKPNVRKSWDFRGEDGWGIGAAMLHYRSQRFVSKATHEVKVTDTVAFRHPSIHQPHPTAEDRLLHGMRSLTDALTDAPPAPANGQLEALERLRHAF